MSAVEQVSGNSVTKNVVLTTPVTTFNQRIPFPNSVFVNEETKYIGEITCVRIKDVPKGLFLFNVYFMVDNLRYPIPFANKDNLLDEPLKICGVHFTNLALHIECDRTPDWDGELSLNVEFEYELFNDDQIMEVSMTPHNFRLNGINYQMMNGIVAAHN